MPRCCGGRIATFLTVGISVTLFVLCTTYVPLLMNKLNALSDSLRDGINEFDVYEENAWKELRTLRKTSVENRVKRQTQTACSKWLITFKKFLVT